MSRSRAVPMLGVTITRTMIALAVLLVVNVAAFAQKRGTISGTIPPPTPTVTVVATNQVTSKITRTSVANAGHYSFKITPGAYRLSVDLPYVARFDKATNDGDHALIRYDSLENVIVNEGKETKIDFAVEKRTDIPAIDIPRPG